MQMSTDGLGKFVRAAVVSGLLGAAGLVAVAGPVQAQDPSPSPSPSPTSGGTGTGGTDGVTTTTRDTGDALPETGMDMSSVVLLGGAAVAGTLGLRRLGRAAQT